PGADGAGGGAREEAMNMFEAIAFDLYGTLVDPRSVESAVARVVTEDPSGFAGDWRQTQLRSTWLRSLMGRYADFWTVTADALDHTAASRGVELSEGDRAALLDAWL